MSGQLPSRTKVYDNAAEFASSIPTFAHYLRRHGYHTILAGKMHYVGPDQLHGFETRTTTDVYPADFGWIPDYRKLGERIDWWYHNLGAVTAAGVAEISNQMEYAAEGSTAPPVAVRDGDFIFIHCLADPPKLFDLAFDLGEMQNLEGDPAYADKMAYFADLVKARCNLERFDADVRESQARRHIVYAVFVRGIIIRGIISRFSWRLSATCATIWI